MIERKIENTIIKSIEYKEITVLIGARQIGKTTILKQILKKLKNTLYFNLDIEQDREYFDSQQQLLKKIQSSNSLPC